MRILPVLDLQHGVVVRGVGPTAIEAVQVDLTGYLRIRNGTAAAFPGARVSVVGTDEARQPPPKPFGLLALNPDTALTDRWLLPPAAEPLVPAVYPLQTEADIPAATAQSTSEAYSQVATWRSTAAPAVSGLFKGPWGVDVGADGRIYVADAALGAVHVLAADGTPLFLWQGGAGGLGQGQGADPRSGDPLCAAGRDQYRAAL